MDEQAFFALCAVHGKKPLRHMGRGWLVTGLSSVQVQEFPVACNRQAYRPEAVTRPSVVAYEVTWYPPAAPAAEQ